MMRFLFATLLAAFWLGVPAAQAQNTPPAAAATAGYLMLVGTYTSTGITGKASLAVVQPDGQRAEEEVLTRKAADANMQLRQAELLKLNELKRTGWTIAHAYSIVVPFGAASTAQAIYLLERR